MSAMWFAARARVHRSDGRAYPSSPQMFLVSERGLHSRAHVYVQNVFGRRAADGGLKVFVTGPAALTGVMFDACLSIVSGMAAHFSRPFAMVPSSGTPPQRLSRRFALPRFAAPPSSES